MQVHRETTQTRTNKQGDRNIQTQRDTRKRICRHSKRHPQHKQERVH